LILAIETSCDDTCAAVLDGHELLSNVVSSQDAFHARYGGVVPEVASRQHLRLINKVVSAALENAAIELSDVNRIAVTTNPGLIGALLIGVATAKSLAAANGSELAGVSHLEGHIAANFLEPEPMEPPFICLIASGGHTSLVHVQAHGRYRLVGQTLDDAAGEALDKGARMLGLGYPGGAELDRLAKAGDSGAVSFPVGLDRRNNYDFSFSGVKTAFYYYLRDLPVTDIQNRRADLAASYQAAVVEALVGKTMGAADAYSCRRICLAGGVSANSRLRERLTHESVARGFLLRMPPPELCTDNAAMIASAARFLPALSFPDYLGLGAQAVTRFGCQADGET
jgi:N6-L-threonylcarbamoyladenine synthase